jgi:hypothetical protein
LLFQLFSWIEGTKPQKPKLKVSRKANTSTIRQQPRETKLEANVKILKLPLEDRHLIVSPRTWFQSTKPNWLWIWWLFSTRIRWGWVERNLYIF